MPKYILTPAAKADIREIWSYTNDKWGNPKADGYTKRLHLCFKKLAETPKIGRLCDDIRLGYRNYPEGKHIVFYSEGQECIKIVRILHQRMKPKRYLK